MFAIRDDDTSYWTSVAELQELYGKYLDQGLKVSLAVVPQSVQTFDRGTRKKMYQKDDCHYVYENKPLVDFLKYYIRQGKIEIMQHGYDHSYYVQIGNENVFLDEELRKKIGDTDQVKFVPECIHKQDEILKKQLEEGNRILEDTFGTWVQVFVPPSNALRPQAVEIVEKLGMNISGTMTDKFNRKVDMYSVNVYLRKALWRLTKHGISYPYTMKYKAHKELTGYAFTPSMNMEKFKNQYEFCKRNNCNFTLATHYWELLSDIQLKDQFYKFLDTALQEQKAGFVSEVF